MKFASFKRFVSFLCLLAYLSFSGCLGGGDEGKDGGASSHAPAEGVASGKESNGEGFHGFIRIKAIYLLIDETPENYSKYLVQCSVSGNVFLFTKDELEFLPTLGSHLTINGKVPLKEFVEGTDREGQPQITTSVGEVYKIAMCSPQNPVRSFRVTPFKPAIFTTGVMHTQQMKVIGTCYDGLKKDLTTSVTWASSNPESVGFAGAGVAKGISLGDSVVTATYENISGSTTVRVTDHQTIFISSKQFNGDLGGSRGADAICQTLWQGLGGFGTARAYIAQFGNTGVGLPFNLQLSYSAYNLRSVADGGRELVAMGGGLAPGTQGSMGLLAAIRYTEVRGLPSVETAWTGLGSDSGNCSGFTSATTSYSATVGNSEVTTTYWYTSGPNSGQMCDSLRGIYCIDGQPNRSIENITVTPLSGSQIHLGDTHQMRALAEYSDGATVDISKIVTWSLSPGDPDHPELPAGTATLSPTGLLTTAAGTPGVVRVTASFGSLIGSSTLTLDSIRQLVFMTSVTFSSALGGAEGADARCQAIAMARGLSGSYRAIISSATQGPKVRIQINAPIYNLDLAGQTLVANNVNPFFSLYNSNWGGTTNFGGTSTTGGSQSSSSSSSLYAALNFTEMGTTSMGYVWTGSNGIGERTGGSCDNWTNAQSTYSPNVGSPGITMDGRWLSDMGSSNCSYSHALLCINGQPERPIASLAIGGPAGNLHLGNVHPITATANYVDGTTMDVTSTVSWSVVNGTGAANIGAQTGLLTTVGGTMGTISVKVSIGAISATRNFVIDNNRQFIFVTSVPYAPNFGGFANADASCQARAAAAGLTGSNYGNWKAIISQSGSPVAARLTIALPLYNMHGDLVSNNVNSFFGTGSTYYNAIRYTETGAPVNATEVWTGSDPLGNAAMMNCSNWTVFGSTAGGAAGKSSGLSPAEAIAGLSSGYPTTSAPVSTGQMCDVSRPFYCLSGQ